MKESLACARSADARYEVALTLMAQAHLAAARGLDGSIPQEEARRILGSLGVVSLPEPPVLAAAQA